jgi:very-short-patch-repair endonuclease
MRTEKTRTQVNEWLYRNTRPGFVFAPPSYELQLTYADQRGGHGTAHWWRLYYGDSLKSQVETILQGTALTVTQPTPQTNQANSGVRAPYEWGGMYFRSKVEIKIGQELEKRGVTFFANVRGRYSLDGSPVSKDLLNGRVELDFLVFHQGKCVILQIDGPQHKGQRERDYAGDRLMLREGIPTVRFTTKECQERQGDVVAEFLAALEKN